MADVASCALAKEQVVVDGLGVGIALAKVHRLGVVVIVK